jgi:hypothetical protein
MMVHRRELRHPGLAALTAALDALDQAEHWLEVPSQAWFADGDRAVIDQILEER